jgi:hypothetical protein
MASLIEAWASEAAYRREVERGYEREREMNGRLGEEPVPRGATDQGTLWGEE